MRKICVIAAVCVIALAQIAFAQVYTQFLTFNDNNGVPDAGTYNPNDSFSFDIFMTFSGYNSAGLSLWFETTANAAPHMMLTGYQRGTTFLDGGAHSFPLAFTLLQSNGQYTTPNPSDLGSTVPGPPDVNAVPPGTYFLESLSVSLSGLAPGTYILESDATRPHASVGVSFDGTTFHEEPIPVATYTITIVPEPSTLALITLTLLGVGAWTCRRIF